MHTDDKKNLPNKVGIQMMLPRFFLLTTKPRLILTLVYTPEGKLDEAQQILQYFMNDMVQLKVSKDYKLKEYYRFSVICSLK
jgi:hypothetical protein